MQEPERRHRFGTGRDAEPATGALIAVAPGQWQRATDVDGRAVVEAEFGKARDVASVRQQLEGWLVAVDECIAASTAAGVPSPLLRPDLLGASAQRHSPTLVFPSPRATGAALLLSPTTPGEILSLLGEVAAALDELHARHFVHGALGLDSLWRMPDGTLRFADAALGHVLHGLVPAAPSAGAYEAPEVWRGAGASPASDQYSLAVIAYELFTGHSRVVYDGEGNVAVVAVTLAADERLYPGNAASQQQILLRALATAPAARFPSCTAFIEALREDYAAAVTTAAPAAAAVTVSHTVRSGGSGSPRSIGTAFAACIVVVAIALMVRAGFRSRVREAQLTAAASAPVATDTVTFMGTDAARSGANLGAAVARLRLTGPAGARFYVDGVLVRPVRDLVTVREGEHDVMIVVPGRESVRRRVTVRNGETIPLPAHDD